MVQARTGLTDAQLRRLRETLGGDVVAPADSDYDEARRLWNAVHDRRPAVVVRPRTIADVATAIRFAREHDLELAVKAGGHSPAGHSTCDGGLVVDLSGMRGVTVDPSTRTARANGGAFLGELDVAAQAYGLVCPVGVIGHTGVAGLTLGGGVGRLQRRFGLTIDSLRAVELVTADGRSVRASETEEPELFWGIRGAGWNFGIVTAFEFELHPFGPDLHRGVRIYPASAAHEAWAGLRGLRGHGPDTVSMIYWIAPPRRTRTAIALGRPRRPGHRRVVQPQRPRRGGRARHRGTATGPGATLGQRRQRALSRGPDGARPRVRWGPPLVHQGPVRGRVPARGARCARRARRGWSRRRVVLGHGPGRRHRRGSRTGRRPSRGRAARFDHSADAAWEDPADDDANRAWVRAAMAVRRARRDRGPLCQRERGRRTRPRRARSTATRSSPAWLRSSGPGIRTTSSG